MSQRIALFLSIALTAFGLVFIGAAINVGRQVQAAAVSPTLDPQLLAQLQTREAAYQAMIEQANAQVRATEPMLAASPTPAPDPTAAEYPISPDLAAYIALSSAPNAYLVKSPELVVFHAAVAYEVTLSTGRVYVDANTGVILWNGAAGNASAGSSANRGGDNEGDDD